MTTPQVVGHAGGIDGLDVTAFCMGDQHLALLWTAPIGGERTLVGLELAPRLDVQWRPKQWSQWLADRFTEREGLPLVPLPVGQVRGVPLRDLMTARATHLGWTHRVVSAFGLVRPDGTVVNLEPEDQRQLGLLMDAVRYVQALEAGLSPAKVIAEARGVSPRTAEGRITRARQAGLLTPAKGRALGGELTERAKTLVRKFQTDKAERKN